MSRGDGVTGDSETTPGDDMCSLHMLAMHFNCSFWDKLVTSDSYAGICYGSGAMGL